MDNPRSNPFAAGALPEGCINIDAADHALVPLKFVMALEGGRTSLPCDAFASQTIHTASGLAYLLVQLSHLGLVLHEAFTPEGARLLAHTLLRAADEAEAAMLGASNAQLDAVLAKGKSA